MQLDTRVSRTVCLIPDPAVNSVIAGDHVSFFGGEGRGAGGGGEGCGGGGGAVGGEEEGCNI